MNQYLYIENDDDDPLLDPNFLLDNDDVLRDFFILDAKAHSILHSKSVEVPQTTNDPLLNDNLVSDFESSVEDLMALAEKSYATTIMCNDDCK